MNQERIKLLEKYIEEEPDNPFNKYALAMEYYETDPMQSLTLSISILKEHPEYLPTYFKLAHLLWDNEDWEEAETVFEKGIELAGRLNDQKALSELNAAYQNFQFDKEG